MALMMVVGIGLLSGCKSDEEKCSEAQAAAHEAWSAYLAEAEAAAEETKHLQAAADEAFEQAVTSAITNLDAAVRRAEAADEVGSGSASITVGALRDVLRERGVGSFHDVDSTIAGIGAVPRAYRLTPELVAPFRTALEAAHAEHQRATAESTRWNQHVATVRAAVDAADGSAVVFRNAVADVEGEGAAFEHAKAAAEESWEACHAVSP
ncbi:MAG: hypothetical protein JJ863_17625 [Deltaproteobacteria bacterium]|nr:hypothetical protein [Deltaproteobacteria bacterium]